MALSNFQPLGYYNFWKIQFNDFLSNPKNSEPEHLLF